MILKAVEFILKNFAAPIVFYATFNVWGAKPAIASALGITLVVVAVHAVTRTKPSPFFLVASGFTLAFGAIDLVIETPQYFRFEPFAQNFLMGTIFLIMQLLRVPVAAWFMQGLPKFVQMELVVAGTDRPHERNHAYLRKLTWIWTGYMYVKAALFLWMAFQYDLGNLILLRSIFGGGSLGVLIVGEILYRKKFRR